MFIGACAGSTGGGMKVSRIIIWAKESLKELLSLIHPRSVKVMKLEKKPIEHTVTRSANAFLIAYLMVFGLSVLIVSLDNYDFTTTFSAVAATFNNIGPGLGIVGPMSNFSALSGLSKYTLMFDMLAVVWKFFQCSCYSRQEPGESSNRSKETMCSKKLYWERKYLWKIRWKQRLP